MILKADIHLELFSKGLKGHKGPKGLENTLLFNWFLRR